VQLELPLGIEDEQRGPRQQAKARALDGPDHAVVIRHFRDRFGWEAVDMGLVALGLTRPSPTRLDRAAEKEL